MRTSIFQNSNEKIVRISSLTVFIASLGLPVGFLIYNITYLVPHKAQKASRKLPGSYKKFQGRNAEIISLVFWKKFSDQKDILKLTDL